MLDGLTESQQANIYPEPTTGCWLWGGGGSGNKGYGGITLGGKWVRVHRGIYELLNGPIPAGQVVMHRCDVRRCMNPSHLKLGTQLQNIQDRCDKGRSASNAGERAGRAKLTWEKVRAIRLDYAMGAGSFMKLAAKYGVSATNIRHIVIEKIWREEP